MDEGGWVGMGCGEMPMRIGRGCRNGREDSIQFDLRSSSRSRLRLRLVIVLLVWLSLLSGVSV